MVRLLHILSQQAKVSSYFLITLLISIFIGGIDTKGYAQAPSCSCTFTSRSTTGGGNPAVREWTAPNTWTNNNAAGCAGKTLPGT